MDYETILFDLKFFATDKLVFYLCKWEVFKEILNFDLFNFENVNFNFWKHVMFQKDCFFLRIVKLTF